MKASNLKKIIVVGLAFASLALTPTLRANVEVFLEGGSASQSVIYDRATNFFAGGTLTVKGGGSSAIAQFSGTSTNPAVSGYGNVLVLTNSIGTVAVQNIKKGVAALAYEGVPYSVTNVINGSYPLWGYENYYYITSGQGTPSSHQQRRQRGAEV